MILVGLGAGCASNAKPAAREPVALPPISDTAAASALAFDPPVIAGEPRLELSRADRERSAYVGFEQLTTTHFYLRYDDRQMMPNLDGGFLNRRAISVTSGVRYR